MSRLLIDENLPFSLVRLLKVDCVHASEIAAQLRLRIRYCGTRLAKIIGGS